MPNANVYLPPTKVIPGSLLITAISQSYPMRVGFVDSELNTYREGQLIKLFIPKSFGMQQADGLQGKILTVDNVSFIFYLDIDSTYFDIFSVPSTLPQVTRPASLSPAGSRNLQYDNNSSKVAFQNLNNTGN